MVAGSPVGWTTRARPGSRSCWPPPIVFAAGVYKLPDLLGPLGNGIRGQVLVGSVVAAVAAYLSVRFLTSYFTTRTLTPFAVYCLVAGLVCIVRFA
jgi:undecaprenyl-diphosphatase